MWVAANANHNPRLPGLAQIDVSVFFQRADVHINKTSFQTSGYIYGQL
jgi:hypothetical protein